LSDKAFKRPPEMFTLLPCQHELAFRAPMPSEGEKVYCGRCQAYRTVHIEQEYNIRCGQCRLSRRYGRDLDEAERVAGRHVLGHPAHEVSIMDGEAPVRVIALNGGQTELPYDSLLERRRRLQTWTQGLLPGRQDQSQT
jgi:hypothetical protein